MTGGGIGAVVVDCAAPSYVEDRDLGDEHAYGPVSRMRACPDCGAPEEPEPTEAERERLLSDADYEWFSPDGEYLCHGFGLIHDPGYCYLEAGFVPFVHRGKNTRADVWLRYAGPEIVGVVPAQSNRLIARLAERERKIERQNARALARAAHEQRAA